VELIAGLALILGLWPRAASLVTVVLLLQFFAALSMALAAGNPVICSCFDLKAANLTDAQKLADMKWTLLRDTAILLLPLHVLWVRCRGTIPGTSEPCAAACGTVTEAGPPAAAG
jgi:hypothetical protein